MEKLIDCRGMACPLPVVNAKKAADELHAGDVLTVLVDNEIAVQNLTRFAEHKGFGVSAEKKAEKEYAVIMALSGAAPEGSTITAKYTSINNASSNVSKTKCTMPFTNIRPQS